MAVQGSDLTLIERGGVIYKTLVSEMLALGLRKFAANVGDGSATSFNVDHNLGTLDVIVQVVRISDGFTVIADVTRPSVNRVTVEFAAAPTADQYRVLVTG